MKIISVFLVCFIFIVYSSKLGAQQNRLSKSFYFSVGIEYKTYPKYLKEYGSIQRYIPFEYNENKMISGERLKFGIGLKFLKNRISVKYSGAIKYGHLGFQPVELDSNNPIIKFGNSIKGFTLDESVEIVYNFKINKIIISPVIGNSWSNIGSQYNYRIDYPQYESYGFLYDFKYKGLYGGMYLRNENFEFGIKCYYISNENNSFRKNRSLLIPSLEINYRIEKK